MKTFYRFRSIKSLFEYEELEKQSIYFASPEELNDPMEGFRNLFWTGDKIVWKNLFKHYLLCLERVCSLLILSGAENKIDINSLPIYHSFDELPTSMYKKLFENISEDFFDITGELINKLASRSIQVRREELIIYLDSVHLIGIECIQKNYEKNGWFDKSDNAFQDSYKAFETILNLLDHLTRFENSDEYPNALNLMLDLYKVMKESMLLNQSINDLDSKQKTPNRHFVFVDFPEKYLEAIERLLYPEWYTACFMTECHNSSVWGHYGDSHKGVCLIFEGNGNENEYSLSLFGKNGWGKDGPTFGYRSYQFHKINYEEGFGDIDFFKSIGRLPITKLYSTWYMDDQNVSDVANGIKTNEEEWRKRYWENFHRDILKKTMDWEYEHEYRLLLNGLLDDEIEKEHRLLTYDFNSLKGIVFGIKTSIEDKLKIIEIIKNKCKENKRDLFDFYQAYYSQQEKNIQFKKIAFLGEWPLSE